MEIFLIFGVDIPQIDAIIRWVNIIRGEGVYV